MSERAPLYFQLKKTLSETIIAQLPGNAPIPAERELCERFTVSRTTVRAAIEELVREGVLYRRHGSGTYTVPQRSKPQMTYVLHDLRLLNFPGCVETIRTMAEAAAERGYDLVIRGFNNAGGMDGFWNFAFRENRGGFIISVSELTAEDIRELRSRAIPAVLNVEYEGPSVTLDFERAGELAAEYVHKRTQGRTILLLPEGRFRYIEQFRAGVERVLAERPEILEVPYDRTAAETALRALSDRPAAIICGDDELAAGAARLYRGEPVVITGLNNTYLAEQYGFASVDTRRPEVGRRSAELLADLLEDKESEQQIVLEPVMND